MQRAVSLLATLTVLLIAAACSAPPRAGARLAAAALACDDPAVPRDTSPIYEIGAAEVRAEDAKANMPPSLGAPGRLVVVQFVIDTLGQPDLCTASIVRESHPGLGAALLERVADWRYLPARHQGHAVRQLMRVVVESSGP